MLIQHSQADYLKQWMVQKLKPICDADHEVLSEYVMALLRHDQSENELRLSCLKQLEDFLQQDTKPFVTDLFDHLGTCGAFNGSYQPPEINLSASVLLRKRALAPDEPPYLLTNNTPPLTSLDNQARGSQSSTTAPIPQYTPTQSHPSFLHFPEPQSILNLNPLPHFPPSQIHPYPSLSSNQPRSSKRPRKSICRDYHYRGYCARGSNCQFSHHERDQDSSSSSTYFPQTPSGEAEPTTQPPLGTCIPVVFTTPSLGQQIPGLGRPLPILPAPSFSPNRLEQSVIDQSPHNFNSSLRHPERFSRFEGSPSTPKKSSTTLVIENIPQSSLSDRAVRDYFSIFGPLTSVSVDVYNAQAQVTFKSYEDAKRAYSSPEPVFNNRFVRIHFKRFMGNGPRRSHGALQTGISSPAAAEGFGYHESNNEMNSNGYRHKPVDGSSTLIKSPPVTDPPQQKPDVQVLSQREQELRLKIDAQKRLLEELSQKKAAKSNGTTSHDSDMTSPSLPAQETENQPMDVCAKTQSAHPNQSPADPNNPTSPEPQLVAPKEALLSSPSDPTVFAKRSTTMNSSYVASRGGRKLTNSRTSWTPSGAAPTKAFKLDNRSCTLAVLHLPSSDAREKLKVYFQQFGPIVAVTPLSEDENVFDVSVKFGSRAAAEKALANGLEIPEVGKVGMRWVPLTGGTTGASGSPRAHQPFIPGLRGAHYPGSFSLVNHHASPAPPAPLHPDPSTTTLHAPATAAHHDPLLNHHIDVDLVDDLCIDDERDGCWKR